jgi:miniconductance mechanosensitive channel
MDKFGADGDVIEINLTTVKVRNFDNTTTTIPNSLSSDSFSKLEGCSIQMVTYQKTRFIKTSIRFLNDSELDNLKNRSYYCMHRQSFGKLTSLIPIVVLINRLL